MLAIITIPLTRASHCTHFTQITVVIRQYHYAFECLIIDICASSTKRCRCHVESRRNSSTWTDHFSLRPFLCAAYDIQSPPTNHITNLSVASRTV